MPFTAVTAKALPFVVEISFGGITETIDAWRIESLGDERKVFLNTGEIRSYPREFNIQVFGDEVTA
jgi:hypothetical protein